MKKQIKLTFIVFLAVLMTNCWPEPEEPVAEVCDYGISYTLDGNVVSFDDSGVTAELKTDAIIGKFYDISTDENNGFYFHTTATNENETAPYNENWFTTDTVGNIAFLNSMHNVEITFHVEKAGHEIGERIYITFEGTYDETDNGGNVTTHTITDGYICTDLDIITNN